MNLEKLKPEERVNLAINMTDVVVQICADGIRDQNPKITEEQLREELRERLMYQKRPQLWVEKKKTSGCLCILTE